MDCGSVVSLAANHAAACKPFGTSAGRETNPLHFSAGKKKTSDGTPISVAEVSVSTELSSRTTQAHEDGHKPTSAPSSGSGVPHLFNEGATPAGYTKVLQQLREAIVWPREYGSLA